MKATGTTPEELQKILQQYGRRRFWDIYEGQISLALLSVLVTLEIAFLMWWSL